MDVKYPKVKVKLTGLDSNAFLIMGKTASEMRRAGLSKDQIDEYYKEAKSGDYDNLLQTTMRYVNVE